MYRLVARSLGGIPLSGVCPFFNKVPDQFDAFFNPKNASEKDVKNFSNYSK